MTPLETTLNSDTILFSETPPEAPDTQGEILAAPNQEQEQEQEGAGGLHWPSSPPTGLRRRDPPLGQPPPRQPSGPQQGQQSRKINSSLGRNGRFFPCAGKLTDHVGGKQGLWVKGSRPSALVPSQKLGDSCLLAPQDRVTQTLPSSARPAMRVQGGGL